MIRKDIGFYDEHKTGDLVSRLNSDIQVIQDSLSTNISMFIRSFVFIIVTLVILFVISPVLTGTTFASILVIMIFAIFYARKMKSLQSKIQAEKAAMTTVAEESWANVRTVKAFSNESSEIEKFDRDNEKVYALCKEKDWWESGFGLLVQILLFGSMVIVMYVSTLLYQNGELSIGAISSFLLYMLLLLFNFAIMANVFGNVASIFGATDKVVELMNVKEAINTKDGDRLDDSETKGTIEIRDLKFSYPSKQSVQVLKGVSLTVENNKNRVVALCGTSGCGKSTIISMIERFYDPTSG